MLPTSLGEITFYSTIYRITIGQAHAGYDRSLEAEFVSTLLGSALLSSPLAIHDVDT